MMKISRKKIVDDFRAMIRIKTISKDDIRKMDMGEFAAFRKLLSDRFPVIKEMAEVQVIPPTGILFKIKGESADAPSVLMAHMDVVPADQEGWTCDPFGAEIKDGRIYGRGTLDTKGTLCAIMEAVEYSLGRGWKPKNDLYLSFGGEEEVSGETAGNIAEWLGKAGVRPAFVLDEGGAVIPEGVPGLKRKTAMVGIAEKGTANYMLSVRGQGGHASTPPRHTAIGKLAKAAVRLEEHPFPARLTTPVRLMFREIAKEVPVYERAAFANANLLEPAIKTMASALGPTFNAMVRTTTAVVIFEGRSAFNVLPDRAAMGVNVRMLEGDTPESVRGELMRRVKDPEIEVDLIAGTPPTSVSEIDCREWEMLKKVIRKVWKDVPVGPYQLNGGTDSRFFSEISNHVYRFTPMEMTAKERATVHGANESISVKNLLKTVLFYRLLLEEL
ncbi:MAG: M20/M25/M40 family metallo-hydrolase [Lachnospiraceae bacterium]|nr:M20/M25/M40 family metallo-hydrolase [Lachnospiraceae bacterium]